MVSPRPGTRWIWPLTLVILAAIAAGTFLYVFRTLSRAPAAAVEEGKAVIQDLARVAAAFRTGTVTTTFISYATEATGVNRLQLAELRQMELFERTDRGAVLWGQMALPDLVVRARAPVEYTYYVDLDARWDLELDGDRIRVVAPPIAFNKPSVDASDIEYEVAADSLLRNEDEALERLKAGITAMSRRRAADNVPLIRELARRKAEDFIAGWLATQFVDGGEFTVDVLFRDELPADARGLDRIDRAGAAAD